jgi:hypothetical protein
VRQLLASVAVALVAASGGTAGTPPTKVELEALTRAAVRASGARLVRLQVVPPNRAYRLVVKPAHPAPYLKHRVNVLVDVMNRLTRRFTVRYFAVLGPSGQRVLWVEEVRHAGGETIRWNMREYLADCARAINLEIEVDPDHAAPDCPAP